MKALVTCSEEGGGDYDRVKEGASIGVALWRGREAVRRERRRRRSCQLSEGGRGRGARPGGSTQPAWPLGAKRPDGPAGHRVKS
jgi:hypothetical protein